VRALDIERDLDQLRWRSPIADFVCGSILGAVPASPILLFGAWGGHLVQVKGL